MRINLPIASLFAFCLLFFLSSCSEEELLTDAEFNAQRIERILSEKDVDAVTIFRLNNRNEWYQFALSEDFQLGRGFIRVGMINFNLEKLQHYWYNDTQKRLLIYLD